MLGFGADKWERNVGYLRSRIQDENWNQCCINQLCRYLGVKGEERALYFGEK